MASISSCSSTHSSLVPLESVQVAEHPLQLANAKVEAVATERLPTHHLALPPPPDQETKKKLFPLRPHPAQQEPLPARTMQERLEGHRKALRALCANELSLLREPDELRLLDRVLVHSQVVDRLGRFSKDKAQIQGLLHKAEELWQARYAVGWAFLEIPNYTYEKKAQAAFAERVRATARDQGIPIKQAWLSAVKDLEGFIKAAQEEIQALRRSEEQMSALLEKEEPRLMALTMLLGQIVAAKKEGKNTTRLVSMGKSSLYRSEKSDPAIFEHIAKEAAFLRREPAQPKKSQKSFLNRIVCFYEGSNLLKRQGYFHLVDLMQVPEKEVANISEKLDPKGVAALLAQAKPGEVVHVSLKEGALVKDPQGAILLYKEPVESVFDSKVKADFGTRQRAVLEEGALVRRNKEYTSWTFTESWNDDRKRSAAIDAAESTLLMQALSEKVLTAEMDQVSFHELTNALGHLDAVASNDLARKPGSYLHDETYLARRAMFNRMRVALENSVFAREASKETSELISSYNYSWKKDGYRVKVIEEIYRNILLSLIRTGKNFLEAKESDYAGAKTNPIARQKLSLFIKGIEEINAMAQTIADDLRAAFPHLREDRELQRPEEIREAHRYLQEHEAEITASIMKFVISLDAFQEKAIELSVAANSPVIQKKLREVLSYTANARSLLSCLFVRRPKGELQRIQGNLEESLLKTQVQSPSTTGILLKELFNGTPFSAALLKTARIFEQQKRGFMTEYKRRQEKLFSLQGTLGYKGALDAFIQG